MIKSFWQFYLVDQTIDIRVLRSANDGYEPNSTYLHRIKVPKDPNYPISNDLWSLVRSSNLSKQIRFVC